MDKITLELTNASRSTISAFEATRQRPGIYRTGEKTSVGTVHVLRLDGAKIMADITLDGFPDLAAGILDGTIKVHADIAEGGGDEALFPKVLRRILLETPDTQSRKVITVNTTELKERVATLTEKLAAVDAAKDSDIAGMLTKDLTVAQESLAIAERSDEDRAAAEEARAETAKLKEENARLKAAGRDAQIKEFLSKLTLPAVRPSMTALYTFALDAPEGTRVKVFSEDGKQFAEKTPLECVTEIMDEINRRTKMFFKVFDDKSNQNRRREEGYEPDGSPGSAGKELDRLVKVYQEKHPEVVDYITCLDAVMKENPEIAKVYEEETAGH